ncbi:MAG: hypothetical protein QOJ09_1825 [Actinomycetota bacterium]|nr:hypothetical protein [Actinomycetota bacterium]
MVTFDAARIAELAADVADKVGLPAETVLRIDVDENEPLGRTTVASLDPIVIKVEGGAFEDAKRPRQMSDRGIVDVLGRLLFRVKDRLDPAFGEPPADDALSLQQQTAWDAYAVGRADRAGLPVQQSRRLYHFRNRHGFTDAADAAFARLWSAESLTWADIEAVCADTAAGREAAV